MTIFTKETNFLETLRKSSFSLESLPDAISIPDVSDEGEPESKALLLATVDDLAFAQQGLNKELSRIVQEMESLRRVHDIARGYGAKGADYALEFLREHGEVK